MKIGEIGSKYYVGDPPWDPWSAPGAPSRVGPLPTAIPPAAPHLTEDRVREIVRDELAKIAAKALTGV